MHYPPFLCEPDEAEHYDNVAEPGRSWLLSLLEEHAVEALFCGHVHHFFWNRLGATDHYLLPAMSFVRPEYTELVPVAPDDDEFGRNDVVKLGFGLVHVYEQGHRFEPVRTHLVQAGTPINDVPIVAPRALAPCNPLGVSLRQNLGATHEVPLGNLDAFRRKAARNDLAIQAMWELGVHRLRVPARDLVVSQTRARLEALVGRGMALHVFSTESEIEEMQAFLLNAPGLISTWEIVSRGGTLPSTVRVAALQSVGIEICLSVTRSKQSAESAYFSHFPRDGFSADDPRLNKAASEPVQWIMGRVQMSASVSAQLEDLSEKATGVGIAAHLEFPRVDEGIAATDDALVASRVLEALDAAHRFPNVRMFIETFIDHDRGYFPRHGLLDRGGHPREGFYALKRALYKDT